MAYDKRTEFELYNVNDDPFCLHNLVGYVDYVPVEKELKTALQNEMECSGDPRMIGPDKEIFETYIRYSPIRLFPKPDWKK